MTSGIQGDAAMQVDEIIRTKGSDVVTTTPEATVERVLHRLRSENIGALVVSESGKYPNGIISERDIVRALSAHGAEALQMKVEEVMTKRVQTCALDSKLQDVMATMTRKRFRQMPVISDGVLVGIVSIGDLVKHRLDELEMETRVLRDRVIGSR